MQLFKASIKTVVLRYYLMMALVFVALFGKMPLLAILAAPLFLSALMAVKFGKT